MDHVPDTQKLSSGSAHRVRLSGNKVPASRMCILIRAGSFSIIDPCIAVALAHNPDGGGSAPAKRMSDSDIHASCCRRRRRMRIFNRCLIHPGNMIFAFRLA
jgi:hypothetical protein